MVRSFFQFTSILQQYDVCKAAYSAYKNDVIQYDQWQCYIHFTFGLLQLCDVIFIGTTSCFFVCTNTRNGVAALSDIGWQFSSFAYMYYCINTSICGFLYMTIIHLIIVYILTSYISLYIFLPRQNSEFCLSTQHPPPPQASRLSRIEKSN